ncbi:MAG TPA: NAD-dependent epimerase/dehydratase family protein [Longimicrobium sp.]|nr:NAD-dependent epimerase/dehydratase family protein [Longimicrobium sp.]
MAEPLASGGGAPKVLVTGAAGFIGSHLAARLVERGHQVVGVDNFDAFYDPERKRRNVAGLAESGRFRLVEADILSLPERPEVLEGIDVIVHLAARAGVRPSIQDPLLYSRVNLDGTVAVLEAARRFGVGRFVFGSSSSVYGNNPKVPFSESDPVERPISPYAATKRAGELLCHTYHHLFGLSVASLRFFTVYGPRQRPDLAIHSFTRRMLAGEAVPLFGDGSSRRDYTYVDDIVQGIEGAIRFTGERRAFEIFNLGESVTTTLLRLVELIAAAAGVEPRIEWLPPQPGDVEATFADVSKAREMLGYTPSTRVEEGIPRFVEWFRAEHAHAVSGRADSVAGGRGG